MNDLLNKVKGKLGIYPWYKKILYIVIAVIVIIIVGIFFFGGNGLNLIMPKRGSDNGGAAGKKNPDGTDTPDEGLAKSIDKKLDEIEKFLD